MKLSVGARIGAFGHLARGAISSATKGRPVSRFNNWLAGAITDGVSTMWCAYAFAFLAIISLPDALKGGAGALVGWIAQTFLQLVLLSIIMVGQKVEAAAIERRDVETHDAVMEMLSDLRARHDELHRKHDDLHKKIGATKE